MGEDGLWETVQGWLRVGNSYSPHCQWCLKLHVFKVTFDRFYTNLFKLTYYFKCFTSNSKYQISSGSLRHKMVANSADPDTVSLCATCT